MYLIYVVILNYCRGFRRVMCVLVTERMYDYIEPERVASDENASDFSLGSCPILWAEMYTVLTEFYNSIFHSVQENSWNVSLLDHLCFLPHPFEVTTPNTSY
jgi:hypothetical protein